MKSTKTVARLVACLTLTCAAFHVAPAAGSLPVSTSSQNLGTVSGRVQNVVTGRYLNNARVTVKQTDITAMTDEFGYYQVTRVPTGPIVLEVFYTGLDVQQIPLNVPAGQSITQDVNLTSVARFGAKDAVVHLDPFTVESTRVTEGAEIAINEQRSAPNLKNVVATEAFGDVVGGNSLGEFLKFVPGLQTSSGQFESESVSVRGFPANFTVVSSNGAEMATSQVSGNSRNFGLQAISINSVARVEATKVPTPATGADTMAGSVNLVGRNAFESARAKFDYQVNLMGSHLNLTLNKKPATDDTYQYRIRPGFSFNYILPLNNKIGFVLSGSHSNMYVVQNSSSFTNQTSATGTTASRRTPFLSNWALTDGPQYRWRSNITFKVDWRVTPHSVLSFTAAENYQLMLNPSNMNINIATGTAATPTVTGGVPFSFGEAFTNGATGRGNVTYQGQYTNRKEATNSENLQYRFDNGEWKVEARTSLSIARAWFRSIENGNFYAVQANFKFPVRVVFSDIRDGKPGKTQVFNNSNQEVDLYDPNNYNLSAASGTGREIRDQILRHSLDVKRTLRFLPFPASVQVGGALKEQKRDRRLQDWNYTYLGLNGNLSSSPYLAQVYANQKLALNNVDRGLPWIHPERAFQAWTANPTLFTMTPAQMVAKAKNAIGSNSQFIKETVPAYYVQTEMKFLNNRLNVLTGVRYEETKDDGLGPLIDPNAVFVRNADGNFARNAAGQRIRKPEAGAVGSMEELRLTDTERGYRAKRIFDGYYPSLHLSGNITERFVARAAYAKTYGRPNFSSILPSTTVRENDLGPDPDPALVQGIITVTNTGLRPWTADNFDLSLEYYTDSGGLFGASVFHKKVRDFFGTFAKVPTVAELAVLGLGPEYEGWQVNSTINAGDATVSGTELSMNHSLRRFGAWGQYFKVFANFTKLELKGDEGANFSGFLPKSANWGVTFSKKPLIVIANWNYRGEDNKGTLAAFGPDAYTYLPSRAKLDLNLQYFLRPNLSISLSAQNVTNIRVVTYRKGSEVPDYAKKVSILEHGIPFSIGIKGSF